MERLEWELGPRSNQRVESKTRAHFWMGHSGPAVLGHHFILFTWLNQVQTQTSGTACKITSHSHQEVVEETRRRCLRVSVSLHPLLLRGTGSGRDAHLGFHLAVASWALTLFTVGTLKAGLADAAPITPTLQGLSAS